MLSQSLHVARNRPNHRSNNASSNWRRSVPRHGIACGSPWCCVDLKKDGLVDARSVEQWERSVMTVIGQRPKHVPLSVAGDALGLTRNTIFARRRGCSPPWRECTASRWCAVRLLPRTAPAHRPTPSQSHRRYQCTLVETAHRL